MLDAPQAMPASQPSTRPALHFTAKTGWINDPLGLTYHEGRYHLFFQYVPGQTEWAPGCYWGHAVSADLLTWAEQEPVLEPGDGDGGCWSGSLVVNDEGEVTIFYTSVQLDDLDIGRIRTARPVDQIWNTWRKGPIVDSVVPTSGATIFRDPQVSRHGRGWRMLVGSGRSDGTPTALAYTSPDLIKWSFDGEFASRSSAERDPVWTGKAWECPQLVPLGDKHALLFSVWEPWIPHYEAYAIGSLDNGEFLIESWGRLTYGDAYYAGSTFTDAEGRPGLIYWLRGVDDAEGQWTGAHSVPHLLRLDENDRILAEPHPNVAQRRGPVVKINSDFNGPVELPSTADVEWNLSGGLLASLSVRSSDGTFVMDIAATDDEFRIAIADQMWTMPPSAAVRIVFDGPVVELFSAAGVFAAGVRAGARTISLSNSACFIHEL